MTELSDVGFFVDVNTGERIPEGECDAHGVPPIGEDENGMWWGTSRAAWILSPRYYTVEVWGHLGAEEWQGVFVGTEEEAIAYAEAHGVIVDGSDSGA